jgi:seryl-tRNA synthetase
MLDPKEVEKNLDKVEENLKRRGAQGVNLLQLKEVLGQRKVTITQVEKMRSQLKDFARQIGDLKKSGENEKANMLLKEQQLIKNQEKDLSLQLNDLEERIEENLLHLPNLIDDSVPIGKDEHDNKILWSRGEKRIFSFTPKDHHDLGVQRGLLNFDQASKITGSRFSVFYGPLARLERALSQFMLDHHVSCLHEEVYVPFIVNSAALKGTGQFPKFKEDVFKLEDRDWYLIPTAEVPVTNLFQDTIIDFRDLPKKFCSYTPCFRSEAGSYGRDTKGLIRQHQFSKVELVYLSTSEQSCEMHEQMLQQASSVLDLLELPYRCVLLSSGDIGFSAQKCYDLEVWLPSQEAYREISSISNCGAFQARRGKIRYRDSEGKVQFAHTLNGSGLAVGRTLLAIMENYQQEDGTIRIPKNLIPYMKTEVI